MVGIRSCLLAGVSGVSASSSIFSMLESQDSCWHRISPKYSALVIFHIPLLLFTTLYWWCFGTRYITLRQVLTGIRLVALIWNQFKGHKESDQIQAEWKENLSFVKSFQLWSLCRRARRTRCCGCCLEIREETFFLQECGQRALLSASIIASGRT